MLYIEIIKVMDLDVLPNAQCTQFHGKWAEKDRNFGVTLMIEPVFMRATREGVKIMVVLLPLVADLVPIGHRAAGGAVQMVDGAVGIHLLPPGRAVIGPALRAAAVFLVVIALSAGLAVYRCHGVSSLSHIR